MKKSLTLIAASLWMSLAVSAQTNTWTGATSTAWNTATNWSLGHAPTAAEDVSIPSAPANQPVISGTITPVCNDLTINV
jgi:hypothetical protein